MKRGTKKCMLVKRNPLLVEGNLEAIEAGSSVSPVGEQAKGQPSANLGCERIQTAKEVETTVFEVDLRSRVLHTVLELHCTLH